MIYKLPCCRSDRSHKTELYLQMNTKRKVLVWFGLFPVRQFTTGLQKSSLLWIFAGFFHAGKGIAAEHIVRQSSLLSMRIVLMYLPHRKKNCRWATAKVSLLGWIIFSMMDFSQLIIRHCDTIRIWWSLASWHLSSDLLSNVSLSSSNPGPN